MIMVSPPPAYLLRPRQTGWKKKTEKQSLRLENPTDFSDRPHFVRYVLQDANTEYGIEACRLVGQHILVLKWFYLNLETVNQWHFLTEAGIIPIRQDIATFYVSRP